MAKDHGCAAGSLPGWVATRRRLASICTPGCFWSDWTGTSTCRSALRGSASTKAMSSLERLPQAHSRRSAAKPLKAERIVDPQGELGVAEGLVLVHVVEEVVGADARHRGPARAEAPPEGQLGARREREEVLRGQVASPGEAAEQVEEGEARADRRGQRVGHVEVAPQRHSA